MAPTVLSEAEAEIYSMTAELYSMTRGSIGNYVVVDQRAGTTEGADRPVSEAQSPLPAVITYIPPEAKVSDPEPPSPAETVADIEPPAPAEAVTDVEPPQQAAVGETHGDVTVPPPTTVIKQFKVSFKKRSASFKFSATGEFTGFECALVKRPEEKGAESPEPRYEACGSAQSYKQLEVGRYAFHVRAIGPGGADPKPAVQKFRIT
jgi:hypothetical protein